MFGCRPSGNPGEENLQSQVRELRCTIQKMMLLQSTAQKRLTLPTAKLEERLPLYSDSNGVLTPTGKEVILEGEDRQSKSISVVT